MIRVAILTISDSCSLGKREDVSGQTIEDMLIESEFQIRQKKIVADDYGNIASELEHFSDKADIDVVLTTGGTGLGP